MDAVDRQLLALLQDNCKLSYAELGSRVGLSVSAVNERLKKLNTAWVIRAYTALVQPRAVGLDVCAFIQVLIDRPKSEAIFVKRVAQMPEVQECHHVTGEYSYLLKVRVRNTEHFETFLAESIKSIPGVVRTLTFIVLSTPKETSAVALYDEAATADE